mmetsp:Transcript_38324/g.58408  ORF Transcript_38324/g.58408 Transcript_38324/m.58408 type:complete len:89 (+) Transcript_38324:1-267(+)
MPEESPRLYSGLPLSFTWSTTISHQVIQVFYIFTMNLLVISRYNSVERQVPSILANMELDRYPIAQVVFGCTLFYYFLHKISLAYWVG